MAVVLAFHGSKVLCSRRQLPSLLAVRTWGSFYVNGALSTTVTEFGWRCRVNTAFYFSFPSKLSSYFTVIICNGFANIS
jgi:hypothetical protein